MPTQTKSLTKSRKKTTDQPDQVSNYRQAKINIAKAIELRSKGLSITDIAKHFDCTKQSVSLCLQKYDPNYTVDLQQYKDTRADLFAAKQAQLLFSLTQDDIKSMAPGSRITGAAILYDKERLERGQATEHIAYADMVAQDVANDSKIKEIQAKIDRLMAVEGSDG